MLLTALLLSHACLEPVRIDLDAQAQRQTVVDREPGVYLGHVSTIRLSDGSTLAAYSKGHGVGQIILKRTTDHGLTWSDRLPTPPNWSTSRETPTLFRTGVSLGPDGTPHDELILFSGLYPIRAARSADSGRTWTELEPIGDFGGIVAMGGTLHRDDGTIVAFFHDDGRFLKQGGKARGVFTLLQTESPDQGRTWSQPSEIWSGSDIHLCEPGVVTAPDGSSAVLLLRENRRVRPAHIVRTTDQARTWSDPVPLPDALTGDRHIARYTPDGELVITFRLMLKDDPWSGDWVAWVGSWDDIDALAKTDPNATPAARGRYLVRLKDNQSSWDAAYPGLEVAPDGTLLATTYGHWTPGEKPWILSVRFTIDELENLARTPAE